MLLLGKVGRAEQGVNRRAGHPGQRGGGVDGNLAPGLAQAAALAPLLLGPPPQCLSLRVWDSIRLLCTPRSIAHLIIGC